MKTTGELSEESFASKDVTWKIPNFLDLPRGVDYYVTSPEFRFANATWCLRLFTGEEIVTDDFMDIGLVRLKTSVPEHFLDQTISLITRRGREYDSLSSRFTLRDNESVAYVNVYRHCDIMAKRHFLVQDGTVTVFYKMRVKKEATPEAFVRVKKEAKPEAFASVKKEAKPEAFARVKKEATPEAFARVKKEATPEAFARVKKETTPEAFARVKKEVTPEAFARVKKEATPEAFSCPQQRQNQPTRTELQEASSQTEDPESDTQTELQEASSQTDVPESVSQAEVEEASTSVQKLQLDYSTLLKSEEDSDVCLKVSDKEFRAHRCILRARSKVFSSMFKQETEEAASGEVIIDDLDPDSFPDFLQHVYAGRVESLSSKNMSSLYSAADKYDLQDLKSECRDYMRRTLSVDTFCDVMTLALRHREEELLKFAIEFFKKNLRRIIVTVKWQTFSKHHNTEANELFIKALVPAEENQS